VVRRRRFPVALAVTAVALAGLVALAGVALGRIYHGPLLAQLVAGAAAGAVAVSTGLRRAPAWSVGPASVVAMTAYVVWAVHLSARRAAVPGALTDVAADALRNGIPRLLTAMLPVEPQPDTVVVPVIAAWLAALAAAELGLRAGRFLLGCLPPAALYAGAVYVVGPNAEPAVWPTLTFAALAAAGLALTGRPDRHPVPAPGRHDGAPDATARTALRLRLLSGAAGGLAAVVGLAALLGPTVAARVDKTPVDPRRYVQPPQLDALDENPLIRLSGWALAPEQVLFDVSTSGAPAAAGPNQQPDLRIRLAVLSDYDGVTWRVGATYRTAGRALSPAPAVGDAPTRTLRQRITVAGLAGRLLPAAATPQLVDGVRVAYDRASGTMIRPEGLLPGVAYTVDSATQPLDVTLLPTADVPAGPAFARTLTVSDGVPEPMQRLARQLGADSGAPYQRAVAIEEFLATHYRLVADAPSGHAYPNLSFFLFGPRNGGGQRGTSEQFAAAYAVLARLLGLPARVVVGFRAPPGGGPVTAADAFAWPEVLFDGVGWVPFHPLPEPNAQPRPVEEDFRPEPETSTPPPADAPSATAAPTKPPASAGPWAADTDGGLSRGGLAALGVGAAGLALGGYAVAVPLLRRAQRRRRLTDPDPGRRVVGAWLELTDALRLAGRPAAPHLAATEVAAYARAAVGAATPVRPAAPPAADLDGLADLVNVGAFAGATPDPWQAGRARDEAMAYVGRLRAAQPWWRRVLWSLHPGPLRWHRDDRR
jgi:transglutaminase-like putative cysteine protease